MDNNNPQYNRLCLFFVLWHDRVIPSLSKNIICTYSFFHYYKLFFLTAYNIKKCFYCTCFLVLFLALMKTTWGRNTLMSLCQNFDFIECFRSLSFLFLRFFLPFLQSTCFYAGTEATPGALTSHIISFLAKQAGGDINSLFFFLHLRRLLYKSTNTFVCEPLKVYFFQHMFPQN